MTDVRDPLARLIVGELSQARDTRLPLVRGPLVTIARDYGCGGEGIGLRLSEALEVPLYDKDLIDRVAEGARTDKAVMAVLDETVKGPLEVWLTSLLAQRRLSPSTYLDHLGRVLMGIARHGGVIMGRGSHVILRRQHPFRIRLVGSPERCAARVAVDEALSNAAAAKKVQQKNEERDRFLWEGFHVRSSDLTTYDLVLNTDSFADADGAVELLRAAYHGSARGPNPAAG